MARQTMQRERRPQQSLVDGDVFSIGQGGRILMSSMSVEAVPHTGRQSLLRMTHSCGDGIAMRLKDIQRQKTAAPSPPG